MSGILRRTQFVDDSKGYIIFSDWCRVVTGIGTMLEPRCLMAQRPFDGSDKTIGKFDPTDDIFRTDDIERLGFGRWNTYLTDETGLALHGGEIWPRGGY